MSGQPNWDAGQALEERIYALLLAKGYRVVRFGFEYQVPDEVMRDVLRRQGAKGLRNSPDFLVSNGKTAIAVEAKNRIDETRNLLPDHWHQCGAAALENMGTYAKETGAPVYLVFGDLASIPLEHMAAGEYNADERVMRLASQMGTGTPYFSVQCKTQCMPLDYTLGRFCPL